MKKYKLLFYLLILPLLFFPWRVVHGEDITTGDASAFTCAENLVGNTNYVPWFNEHCITPTPGNCSPTPTVTPCPSISVTPTAEPTVTPTETPSNPGNPGGPGDGRSDGRSDGLSSCPSCTQAPATQAVLGLSTTSGNGNILFQWVELLGAFGLISAGAIFFKKNA